jgi:hypothetical protein
MPRHIKTIATLNDSSTIGAQAACVLVSSESLMSVNPEPHSIIERLIAGRRPEFSDLGLTPFW